MDAEHPHGEFTVHDHGNLGKNTHTWSMVYASVVPNANFILLTNNDPLTQQDSKPYKRSKK